MIHQLSGIIHAHYVVVVMVLIVATVYALAFRRVRRRLYIWFMLGVALLLYLAGELEPPPLPEEPEPYKQNTDHGFTI